jgi:hypothetical protein
MVSPIINADKFITKKIFGQSILMWMGIWERKKFLGYDFLIGNLWMA